MVDNNALGLICTVVPLLQGVDELMDGDIICFQRFVISQIGLLAIIDQICVPTVWFALDLFYFHLIVVVHISREEAESANCYEIPTVVEYFR